MPENPKPTRLPGQPPIPAEPYSEARPEAPPAVVDADFDLFGAEAAAASLAKRLASVEPRPAHVADDGRPLLWPPFAPARDRVDGYATGLDTLVVFGAFGTPWSRQLGKVLAHVREHHHTTLRIVWRHYPDPVAHPRAVVLALATEAAARHGRFWVLTRELLRLSHDDPADVHAAIVRAGLDPTRTIDEMRAGTGADRVVEDAESALASGVTSSPALFIGGERYAGELDPAAVSAALPVT